MTARIRTHVRANVVGYVALFFALTSGAYALGGKNTVNSGDIIDDQVKTADVRDDTLNHGGLQAVDLRPDSVGTTEVADGSLGGADIGDGTLSGVYVNDNSLTGADVSEATLGQVPAAVLGGLGRSQNGGGCDPESATLMICDSVDLTLPALPAGGARVLVIGQIEALDEQGANRGSGSCELGTDSIDLPSTTTGIITGADGDTTVQTDNITLVGVTPPLGPGPAQFRIRCNQLSGAIIYAFSEIAAVALSPS
jgi:hypothetical protein